jgi:uncharacterized protein involved in exopolysaccharide biosynthesis
MRVILASILAAVLLAVAAGAVGWQLQTPVYEAQAVPSVRLDDPGTNLVGPDWSGEPRTAPDRTHLGDDDRSGTA